MATAKLAAIAEDPVASDEDAQMVHTFLLQIFGSSNVQWTTLTTSSAEQKIEVELLQPDHDPYIYLRSRVRMKAQVGYMAQLLSAHSSLCGEPLTNEREVIEMIDPSNRILYVKLKPHGPATVRDLVLQQSVISVPGMVVQEYQKLSRVENSSTSSSLKGIKLNSTHVPITNQNLMHRGIVDFEDDVASIAIISRSVEHQLKPPQPGYVRAHCKISGWLLVPSANESDVFFLGSIDPKGIVPQFLVKRTALSAAEFLLELKKYAEYRTGGDDELQVHEADGSLAISSGLVDDLSDCLKSAELEQFTTFDTIGLKNPQRSTNDLTHSTSSSVSTSPAPSPDGSPRSLSKSIRSIQSTTSLSSGYTFDALQQQQQITDLWNSMNSPLWQSTGIEHGVRKFFRIAGNGVVHYMGQGLLQCTAEDLYFFIKNPQNMLRYDQMVKSVKEIESAGDDCKVLLIQFERTKFLFKRSRSICVQLVSSTPNNNRHCVFAHAVLSVEHPSVAVKNAGTHVDISGWIIRMTEKPGICHASYIIAVDFKGISPDTQKLVSKFQPLTLFSVAKSMGVLPSQRKQVGNANDHR